MELDKIRFAALKSTVDHLLSGAMKTATVVDIVENMNLNLARTESEPYSVKHIRRLLDEHFKNELVICPTDGQENIYTSKETAMELIRAHHRKSLDIGSFKHCQVTCAANYIRDDIDSVVQSIDTYPTGCELSSLDTNFNVVPESLKTLLKVIINRQDSELDKNSKLVMASIGQAIMQTARPRSLILPLQLGMAVEAHAIYGSRYLVDLLHHHGFCSSYNEVKTYLVNAASEPTRKGDQGGGDAATTLNSNLNVSSPRNSFIHYIADNVDHNSATIDGHGTFHGMGVMAAITPSAPPTRTIKRRPLCQTGNAVMNDIKVRNSIPVLFYHPRRDAFKHFTYQPLPTATNDSNDNSISGTDILWKAAWLVRPLRSAWSGWMHDVHHTGSHDGPASFHFYPMIDRKSTDMSCIFST